MNWFTTIIVALITALCSAFLSGLVATRAVSWYRISSFEGGSGYFVVMLAIGGLIGGLVAGFIVARVVAAGANPSFVKGLGFSLLLVSAIAGVTATATRLLADVPPTIKGEQLNMLVELRWPSTQQSSPAADTTPRSLELGALSGRTLRTRKQGPLWMEDARLENGRWIVPGAVEVFTERGTRVLAVTPDIPGAMGFEVPLPARPGAKSLQWSEWMPRARKGAPPLADGFTYRFKVIPRSAPARTEHVGAFDVSTIAAGFHIGGYDNNRATIVAAADYTIEYRGQPGTRIDARAVATLPGTPTALLALLSDGKHTGGCHLIEDVAGTMRTTFVSRCENLLTAEPLTNDQSWRDFAKTLPVIQGLIDRRTFMHQGTYLFRDATFDNEHRTIRPAGNTSYDRGFDSSIFPIGVAPDGMSYVRLGFSETTPYVPALLVFSMNETAPKLLLVDQEATRYPGRDGVNNEWLTHYFAWQRGTDGHDRLVARDGVSPLPYRGAVHIGSDGSVAYLVNAAGKELVDVIVEFLKTDFNAQRTAADEYGVSVHTFIDDQEITVFANDTEHNVSVFGTYGSDSKLTHRIAARFNERLATGKYDALFSYAEKPD